jgi:hypothetical protein
MKLIGDSKVGAVFARPGIVILHIKDALLIVGLAGCLLLEGHSADGTHGEGFGLGAKLIEVHARSSAALVAFLVESGCFGIEVALTAHVVADPLAALEVVLSWTGQLVLLELLDLPEPVSRRMEAGTHYFGHLGCVAVVSWTGDNFLLLPHRFLGLPRHHSLPIKRLTDLIGARVWRVRLRRLHLLHLIVVVLLEAQVVNRYGWHCGLGGQGELTDGLCLR